MKTIFYSMLLSMTLLILGNFKVCAQEFKLTQICPDTIGTDQRFNVSYKIVSNDGNFEIKAKKPFSLEGGNILSGPRVSTITSAQLSNGKLTEIKSIEHIYEIGSNYNVMDIVIEPMSFDVIQDDNVVSQLSTGRKVIKVLKGYIAPETTDENIVDSDTTMKASFPKNIKSKDEIAPDDVIFTWSSDKSEINLGDTVLCNCDLYTQLQPTQLSPISKKLIDGCIILEDTLADMTLETVEYEGRKCYHVRVQSFKIIPLRSGKISIGGNTFALQMASGDAFDVFFGNTEYISYESKSNQTYINVKGKMTEDNETLPSGNDCFLLCDISTSMTANDIEPSRKTCVQEFANQWIKEVPQTGLISFAGGVEQYCAPIQKNGTFVFIDEPKVDGTAIGNAMIAPISCGAKVKDLIIITDGANNNGYFSLNTAFDIINRYGIRVSYIYLNSGNDSIDYVINGLDEPTKVKNDQMSESELDSITKMVKSTGGIFGKAHNKNELWGYLSKLKMLIESEKPKLRTKNVLDANILGRFINLYKEELLRDLDKN